MLRRCPVRSEVKAVGVLRHIGLAAVLGYASFPNDYLYDLYVHLLHIMYAWRGEQARDPLSAPWILEEK
jgi:hypothetical protein